MAIFYCEMLSGSEQGDTAGFAFRWLRRCPRVLLAEDDDDLRSALTSTFHDDGFQVFAVHEGSELIHALDLVANGNEEPFDVVVADLHTSDGDLLEAIRAFRRSGAHTPVIIMSALDEPTLRGEVEGIPDVDFLSEPFNIGDVENAAVVGIGHAP